MLQYPLLITWPKASDYLNNKEEIDLHSNLVAESKVTECNRISLTIILTQKSMSQVMQEEYQDYVCQTPCPEHASEMPVSRNKKSTHIIQK